MSSGARRRLNSTTEKVTSFFSVEEEHKDGKLVKKYVCKGPNCPIVLATDAVRRLKFHVMLCPDTDYGTRKFFHDMSKAKDKPPLLLHPNPGITVAEARNLVKNLTTKMVDQAINRIVNPEAWEADPIFTKFANKRLEVNESRPSNEISDVEEQISHLLLIRHIVDDNLPFAILNRPGGRDRTFAQFSRFIRPGLTLPSTAKLSTELLDRYYEIVKNRVKRDLMDQLYEGHATLMVDSAEDVNQAPVTNLLIRLAGPSRASIKTYYLMSVYTGTAKSNTALYTKMAEDVINEWLGFEKLTGVVTDNTGDIKMAREDLMAKYGRLVASQDQAHVADKLMLDIGESLGYPM